MYLVDTEPLWLDTAGLNTLLTPLKIEHSDLSGIHYWTMMLWYFPTGHQPSHGASASSTRRASTHGSTLITITARG
jgi:hypothetical protein